MKIEYYCSGCGSIFSWTEEIVNCPLCDDGTLIETDETCCLCGQKLCNTGFGGVQVESGRGVCPSCFRNVTQHNTARIQRCDVKGGDSA